VLSKLQMRCDLTGGGVPRRSPWVDIRRVVPFRVDVNLSSVLVQTPQRTAVTTHDISWPPPQSSSPWRRKGPNSAGFSRSLDPARAGSTFAISEREPDHKHCREPRWAYRVCPGDRGALLSLAGRRR